MVRLSEVDTSENCHELAMAGEAESPWLLQNTITVKMGLCEGFGELDFASSGLVESENGP